jgi:hypothetical protein
MITAWLAGCAYHVHLESRPTSARVLLPDEATVVVTPARVELRWVPLGHQWVTVSAPGYRTMRIDVQRRPLRWGLERPPDVPVFKLERLEGPPRIEVLLVPEHGPAGTWAESDVP